jgi:hypothetical protein
LVGVIGDKNAPEVVHFVLDTAGGKSIDGEGLGPAQMVEEFHANFPGTGDGDGKEYFGVPGVGDGQASFFPGPEFR